MKSGSLLIFIIFLAVGVSAQNEKGKIFVETGVKAFGGGDFLNFIGKTGFSYNKFKWSTYDENGSPWQEDSYNGFSWAVAPRAGYYFGDQFMAGIDFQFYQNKLSYEIKYRNFTSGLFVRFDFLDRKISPFLELSSGAGTSKESEDRTSPGGAEYQSVEKFRIFYYSGSVGFKFALTQNLNLNLSVKIQNTIGDEIQNNDDGSVSYVKEKIDNLEIGPMLSITYIFNKKRENN